MKNPIGYQLREIDRLMSELKAEYAILGGVAVSVYGEPRLTYDVDVNVILGKGDIERFLKKAKEHGFLPLPANIEGFVKKTGVMPLRFSKGGIKGRGDFIVARNPLEFQAIKRAHYVSVYSTRAKVIRAEDLVLHKLLSNRPRDREDAISVIKRQGAALDTRYINLWLGKVAKMSHMPALARFFKEARREIRKK